MPEGITLIEEDSIIEKQGPAERLLPYYSARAGEYERVYEKPERRADLEALGRWLSGALRGERVLELACGTGYWTAFLAPAVSSILAVDASPEVLEIARAKNLPPDRVGFALGDAFKPHDIPGDFTAIFAGFFWSHVPRFRLPDFLQSCARRLPRRGRLVFIDNRYVVGSSTPISRVDEEGNTYQRRRLMNDSEYEILKNFPERPGILAALGGLADEPDFQALPHYWGVDCRVRTPVS